MPPSGKPETISACTQQTLMPIAQPPHPRIHLFSDIPRPLQREFFAFIVADFPCWFCGRQCDHFHVRPPHTARGLPFVICWVDPTW